jgi:hypothetical protein
MTQFIHYKHNEAHRDTLLSVPMGFVSRGISFIFGFLLHPILRGFKGVTICHERESGHPE